MDLQTHDNAITPNMERVIQAGDTLVIQDKEGQEFAVSAREHEDTLAFLKTFDLWLTATKKREGKIVCDALFLGVEQKFNAIPMHIQRQLPSFKSGGVIIRDHLHGNS